MKKVILTGSTGFIGSALYQELKNRGYDVLGISRNSIAYQNHEVHNLGYDSISKLQAIISNFNPNIILHFAANPLVKDFKHEITISNALATHQLLECCPKECLFGFASSATVYGKHTTPRDIYSATKPISIYGASKLYCENLIKLYYKIYKKIDKYIIYRFCAHIGPHATHGLLYDLVKKLRGPDIHLELLGKKPGSRKSFIHIDDSINSIIEILERRTQGPVYTNNYDCIHNIAPCQRNKHYFSWTKQPFINNILSVEEVANILMEELNIQKPIKWLGNKSNWAGDNKYVGLGSSLDKIRTSEQAIRDYARTI